MLPRNELEVLASLFPDKDYKTIKEIQKKCGYSYERVYSAVLSLRKKNILELKKYGNVIVASVNYNSDFALLGFIHYAINRKLNFYEKQKNILYGGELSKSGTSRVADSDEISKCIKKVENLNAEFMSVIDVSTKPKNKITFFYIGDKKLENELLGLEYKYNIRLDSVKGTIELLKDQENAKKYLEGVILKGFEKFFTAFYYNK